MKYVLDSDTRYLTPRPYHVEGQLPRIRMPNTLHHHIRAPTSTHLLNLRNRIIVQLNNLSPQLLRLRKPLRHTINSNNIIHHRQRARNSANSHGSAPNTDNGKLLLVPLTDILEEAGSSKIPRRKNIRHQHQHLLRNILRRLHQRRLRQRRTHILGLTTRNGIRRRAIPKQLSFTAS